MAGEQSAYTATGNPILITDTYMSDIADAIRAKTGSVDTYTPAQMASAISAIETGSSSTHNGLLSSVQGNYHCNFTTVTQSSGVFGVNLTGLSGLTNTKQIRYIILIAGGSPCYIYDRSSWLDYGYRSTYSSYGLVPFTWINGALPISNSQHHRGFWTLYSSASTDGRGFRKIDLEVNTLNLQIYNMKTSGNRLGSATTPSSLYTYYSFVLWDDINCIPTE